MFLPTIGIIFTILPHLQARLLPAGAGYVGAGYNILFGNNDGARFASGGPDPGFRLTNMVLKKSFSAPDDYCPTEAICTEIPDGISDDQFSLVADLVQYQKLYSAAWEFESEEALLPLEGTFAGLRSSPIAEATDMIEHTKSIITEKRNVAVSGELRYNHKENTKLTSEFVLTLCELPVEYDADTYRRFITAWGTHVIVAVKVGRMDITRYEVPFAMVNSLLATTAALTKILTVRVDNSTAAYSSNSLQDSGIIQTFVDLTTAGNSTFRKWRFTAGSVTAPSPVHLTLRRLDKFVTREFIAKSVDNLCPALEDGGNVRWIQSNIKQALLEYPVQPETTVFLPLQREFKIDWPKGSYALIKTTNCPETDGSSVWFSSGKRVFLDTLGMYLTSLPSTLYDMDLVPYGKKGGFGKLTLKFCVKDVDSAAGQTNWPMGSYCIFRKHECPTGFDEGSIATPSWSLTSDTEALPSGVYTSSKTVFEFCCRRDRPVDEAIILPPSHPFTLMSSGGQCQRVIGMESQLQIQTLRKGAVLGIAPFVTATDVASSGMKLYFCYYKKRSTEAT
ncbi:hypothetical protein BV898_09838 [Hypsibius exemplaris]|uniref:MACPF domain-containing protein n=1 Tax=Hypsibius exemplaris TaxID=2072580 RepID=A0A1W0WLI7_HYPEX|nr:hypothetical protein BV898_09838 [Hypsibius exemplaris]